MRIYRRLIFAALALMSLNVANGEQPQSVVEGLKSDTLYVRLQERRVALEQQRSDTNSKLTKLRGELSGGGVKLARKVESAELELFDLLREQSELVGRIQQIEQSWVLSGIGEVKEEVEQSEPEREYVPIGGESVVRIVRSRVVASRLAEDDLEELEELDEDETEADRLHREYMQIYHRMRTLNSLYKQSKQESEAMEYLAEFRDIEPQASSMAEDLDEIWSDIYDNKLYIYSLLLESLEQGDALEEGEMALRDGASRVATLLDSEARAAGRYTYQKRALVGYEVAVAKALELNSAIDSLRGVAKRLAADGDLEPMDDVDIVERNFIEYDYVKFSTKQVYSKSKPIPEAKLYTKGRIYRLQVGAYKYEQLPSIFRGAYPLSYDKTFGFWTYYCGAYATFVEAQKAQALCKAKGFKRPEIVVWSDGERRNLEREPLPATKGFRVQLIGVKEISDGIRSLMETMCGGEVNISKIGANRYIIATISNRYVAEEFAAAVELEDDELRTVVVAVE